MTLPAVSPGIEVADFETELVVLVPDRRRAHLLEPLWALLFDSCQNGHTAERFLGDVAGDVGWDEVAAGSWLDEALAVFEASGVVVATS